MAACRRWVRIHFPLERNLPFNPQTQILMKEVQNAMLFTPSPQGSSFLASRSPICFIKSPHRKGGINKRPERQPIKSKDVALIGQS